MTKKIALGPSVLSLSIYFLLLFSFIVIPTQASAKSISDHRVKSLSCQNVTADSVAQSIRPEVFSSANHLPYKNWSFQWGLYELAGCWSMSRFQRLYFYLREPSAGLSLTELSNQARSADMYEDGHSWKGFPLDTFWFLPDQTDARWTAWDKGWTERGSTAQPLERGRKSDVEYYQVLRFHQLENIKYLNGPLARTPIENRTTWTDLASLISNGRKPLILVRPARYSQHVVVVKRIEQTSTGANIWVYDSNSPMLDRLVTWDSGTEMFSGFDVVNGLPEVTDPHAPVGVFIVDDEENERVLESLSTYYQAICAMP